MTSFQLSRLALCTAPVVIIRLPHKADFSTKHKADLGVMKDLADFSQYTERTWQTGLIFQKMLAGTAGVKAGNLEGRIFVSSV